MAETTVAAASLLSPSLHFLVNPLDLNLTKLSVLSVAARSRRRRPRGQEAVGNEHDLDRA
jgi:hypothetical protein